MSKQTTISIGILLLLIGFELRAVESFVLRPEAGKVVANITNPEANSRVMATRELKPPNWMGWASLSFGFVIIVYATRRHSGG